MRPTYWGFPPFIIRVTYIIGESFHSAQEQIKYPGVDLPIRACNSQNRPTSLVIPLKQKHTYVDILWKNVYHNSAFNSRSNIFRSHLSNVSYLQKYHNTRQQFLLELSGTNGLIKATWQMLSGPLILSKITLKLIMNSQIFWRTVVGWILTNISPSNLFKKNLLLEKYHQNSQVVLGTTGMNGLRGHDLHLLMNTIKLLRKRSNRCDYLRYIISNKCPIYLHRIFNNFYSERYAFLSRFFCQLL